MATKSKSKSSAKTQAGTGLRVRMYRVGFGDFFLLTVPAAKGPQHILIDCGVTPGTTHNGDIGTIKDAVAHMAEETKNHLALIIVTHRHMDHIIGFSRCADLFSKFKVDAIWMPYWESEYDEQAFAFQADLTALAMDIQQHLALAAGTNREVDEMLAMLRNATGIEDDALGLAAAGGADQQTGKGGGTNAQSLALLKTGLRVEPDYYARGDTPHLPAALKAAGLQAEILGPPPADALDFLQLTDLRKGVGQYLGEELRAAATIFDPFGKPWHADASDYHPAAFREWEPRVEGVPMPAPHERLEAAVRAAQPQALLTAVKKLDDCLNNQSLVVLFTFKGKKLLFVGDAQAGNWEYWMCGGTPNKTPSMDNLSAEGKKILGHLDFYKVGHHGSTNATPIVAVEAMGGDFASMCSTQDDSYGNPAKGTEVPRIPLIEALRNKSATVRSDEFAVKRKTNPVPPIKGAPAKPPKPKQGKFEVGDFYVDYLL